MTDVPNDLKQIAELACDAWRVTRLRQGYDAASRWQVTSDVKLVEG